MTDNVRDIALDINGDLKVEGGDLVMIRGLDAIVQSLTIRLQFFKGEWFLALSEGLPYFDEILVKNPNINVLQSIFRREIEKTPGINELQEMALDFDRPARTLRVSFRATSDLGEITVSGLEI